MNTVQRNAAIVAATAMAVTAVVTTTTVMNNETVTNDVVIPSVTIPQIDIPKVDIPQVAVASVETPAIASMMTLDPVILDSLHLPDTETTKLKQKTVQIPMSSFKSLESVIISVPGVGNVSISQVSTNSYRLNIPELSLNNVEIATIGGQPITLPTPRGAVVIIPNVNGKFKIELPEINTYHHEMRQAIEFRKLQRRYFTDLRNLDHDKSIKSDSQIWRDWLKIYRNNQTFNLKKNPISYKIKMIAEVNVPNTAKEVETLDKNLEFYKKQGYNSVLLAFNGTESLSKLIDVEDLILSKGFKVFIAYSGPESLEWSMFIDPSKLEEYLSTLGEKAEGIVIGWRRTALHLFIPDKPYINFILKSAMEKNDKLIVLGEAYLGETADTSGKANSVTVNLPANASGVLVNGIGFNGIDVERALKGVFSQVKDQKRIAVIVGDRPYYLSRNANKRDFQQNLKIKQNLEKQFIDAGCGGTITLHGDSEPVNLNGRQTSSDSLCYSEAK